MRRKIALKAFQVKFMKKYNQKPHKMQRKENILMTKLNLTLKISTQETFDDFKLQAKSS